VVGAEGLEPPTLSV